MEKSRRENSTAYLYAGLAILLWSTVSTAFKISLRSLTPSQLLLGASFVSLCVFFCVGLLQKKIALILKSSRQDLLRSAVLGLLNPFLYYSVLLEAYNRLPAQEAQALNYIWAVMLALLSIPILGQKFSWRDFSGVLISFCGAVVIATRGKPFSLHFEEPMGVSLALASTLIWALFWLFNVRDKRDQVVKLFWIFAFGFIYVLIFVLIKGEIKILKPTAWLGAIYVGIFEMGITFLFWLLALQKADVTARIANLIFLTPFLSLIIIHFILLEKITVSTVCGLVLIIGGILWQQTSSLSPKATG